MLGQTRIVLRLRVVVLRVGAALLVLLMGKSPVLFGKRTSSRAVMRDELWEASLGRSRRSAMVMATICGRREAAWRPGRLGKEKG
jgi:hypothetical protein